MSKPMVQEDSGGVAALMGYSRQRSMDPPHYPMCSGVEGEEIRTHDLSSHPGFVRMPQIFGRKRKVLGSYGKAP